MPRDGHADEIKQRADQSRACQGDGGGGQQLHQRRARGGVRPGNAQRSPDRQLALVAGERIDLALEALRLTVELQRQRQSSPDDPPALIRPRCGSPTLAASR